MQSYLPNGRHRFYVDIIAWQTERDNNGNQFHTNRKTTIVEKNTYEYDFLYI